uniref:Ig-like domain-containing protein n=1 Tax=Cyprinus carpio TaxID=7962 RepID=A0A8C1YW37_CYPCA
MEKLMIIMLFFSAQDFVCWGQDRVEQPSGEMAANKGDPVTLHCNYSTSATNVYIYWYKQLPNRSPTFMLSVFSFGTGTTVDEFKDRFFPTLNSKSKTVQLMIKNLHVSDSAVYYCALQPTVTETHSTLIQKIKKRDLPQSTPVIII